MPFPNDLKQKLELIYEDLMWLANRPHVEPARARAWYSHVMSVQLARKVRRFSGKVSKCAIDSIENEKKSKLVLEHFERINLKLSDLLTSHLNDNINNAKSFIELIDQCEWVNITTEEENRKAQKEGGDYVAANIHLVDWHDVSEKNKKYLWNKMLKSRVSNAADFTLGIDI